MLVCPDFSPHKIVIIGDVMLDRYWQGDTSRISPEAPVPVVRVVKNEERAGGAANVALNVSALGASTTLISKIGDDEAGQTLSALLHQKGVHNAFVTLPGAKTTLKLRVLAHNQQLIRLDFEDKAHLQDPNEGLLGHLAAAIENADVLILSDYAKGVISDPQAIISAARARGVKIIVDPKNRDLSVYKGAQILTPNLGEFEAMVGKCANETVLEEKGLALLQSLDLEGLLVTRGAQGMSVFLPDKVMHIPTHSREVFDVTGAGDTVIAVLAASLAAGKSLPDAAQLSNIAAGIVVGKLGTAVVFPQEIASVLGERMARGILSEESLLAQVNFRKKRGDTVVLTNGCFDILHAGHVTYLQQARALGDCLIIAVNDDDSIRRLKGETRPINGLSARMTMLAALGCVDYVVHFSEDTPERLISTLLPDILVKAADYTPESIAGAKQVLANGGEVKIMPLVEGCSTTNMINDIMRKNTSNMEEVV